MVKFGPSGNSEKFYELGHKSSIQAPKWLNEIGLEAYEYQCSKGINISEESAIMLGVEAKKHNISISIHAPYFISLSSQDREKQDNSIKYITDTLEVARWMGATRVVVHPGGLNKGTREEAHKTACEVMKRAILSADKLGLNDIHICPETMGKINQLGTVEEIIDMCKMDDRLIPTLDFGHINSRGMGSLKSPEDYELVINMIHNGLGEYRSKNFHCHFSRIEFTQGGEKKHWTMADTQYGPEFSDFAQVIVSKKLNPTIICESRGTMAEDALTLKKIYENLL